jgi:hypothetical protein
MRQRCVTMAERRVDDDVKDKKRWYSSRATCGVLECFPSPLSTVASLGTTVAGISEQMLGVCAGLACGGRPKHWQ